VKLASEGGIYTVVGVVGDVLDRDLTLAPSPLTYRPQTVPVDPNQEPGPRPSLVLAVRSTAPSDALLPAIRQIVQELDPNVPVFDVRPMREIVRASTARRSLALALVAAAASTSLLLGMSGLYGLMAYRVALQTREFGIRIALGADSASIVRRVMSHGLVLTMGGVLLGLGLFAIAARWLQSLLFGVAASDPTALAASLMLLVGLALLASWLPARHAGRVNPVCALRVE